MEFLEETRRTYGVTPIRCPLGDHQLSAHSIEEHKPRTRQMRPLRSRVELLHCDTCSADFRLHVERSRSGRCADCHATKEVWCAIALNRKWNSVGAEVCRSCVFTEGAAH